MIFFVSFTFGSKSTFSESRLATPTCFQVPFAWDIVFYSLIFSVWVSFEIKCVFINSIPLGFVLWSSMPYICLNGSWRNEFKYYKWFLTLLSLALFLCSLSWPPWIRHLCSITPLLTEILKLSIRLNLSSFLRYRWYCAPVKRKLIQWYKS